jgi:hypothetical protein
MAWKVLIVLLAFLVGVRLAYIVDQFRSEGRMDPDEVIVVFLVVQILEHEPVFTLSPRINAAEEKRKSLELGTEHTGGRLL